MTTEISIFLIEKTIGIHITAGLFVSSGALKAIEICWIVGNKMTKHNPMRNT
jgi:hypothetical protein